MESEKILIQTPIMKKSTEGRYVTFIRQQQNQIETMRCVVDEERQMRLEAEAAVRRLMEDARSGGDVQTLRITCGMLRDKLNSVHASNDAQIMEAVRYKQMQIDDLAQRYDTLREKNTEILSSNKKMQMKILQLSTTVITQRAEIDEKNRIIADLESRNTREFERHVNWDNTDLWIND